MGDWRAQGLVEEEDLGQEACPAVVAAAAEGEAFCSRLMDYRGLVIETRLKSRSDVGGWRPKKNGWGLFDFGFSHTTSL